MTTEPPTVADPEDRSFQNDLEMHFVNDPKIPLRVLFSPQRVGMFFGVSVSTVTNWQARYEGFPKPVRRFSGLPVFDIRQVVRWWIAWKPKNRAKSGRIPTNWKDFFNE
jgi:hypothetical protein